MINNIKHFAKCNNTEVIVIGFNKGDGTILYVDPASLPGDEQIEIKSIAMSMSGQAADYLIPILQESKHKSGYDWFTYLTSRTGGRSSPLVKFPLKEVRDMHPDQKALMGGYGVTAVEREKQALEEKENPPSTVLVDSPVASSALTSTAPTTNLDSALGQMAIAIASLAETQKKMLEAQTKPVAKRRGRKPATKKD